MSSVGWLAFALAAGLAAAQNEPLAFEVASVKMAAADDPTGYFPKPGTLTIGNRTVRELIVGALGVKPYQVEGGPAWMRSDRFHIVGKAAFPANIGQMMKMVLPLLEDRFQLKFHHESRELRQYALLVAKGGAKLKPATEKDKFYGETAQGITAYRVSMKALAYILSGNLDCPVVDETGLDGEYQFTLQYQESPKPLASGEAADPGNAGISVAIRDQLGLRLEARKGAVDVIVIDRLEKPAFN